jgi:hypothetical protein
LVVLKDEGEMFSGDSGEEFKVTTNFLFVQPSGGIKLKLYFNSVNQFSYQLIRLSIYIYICRVLAQFLNGKVAAGEGQADGKHVQKSSKK